MVKNFFVRNRWGARTPIRSKHDRSGRRRRSLACGPQLQIEPLEDRQLLTAVYFDPFAAGDNTKSVAEWGVDTAWPDPNNVRRSVSQIGLANVDVVRVNYYLEYPLQSDGTLSQDAQNAMNVQLGLANTYAPGKPIALTPSASSIDPSYKSGGVVNVANWIALIKASMAYVTQQTGRPVTSVEPFNEPDYTPQGTKEELYNIMAQMASDPTFTNVLIQGPSTLASEQAAPWYAVMGGPATSGSTHLLGSGPQALTAYADFYAMVKAVGDVPYNPEVHSMAESIVGADRGLQGGIFWGAVEQPRAQFVKSSDGVRLGYAEDLTNQNAAAIYRGPDGQIYGFAGGVERTGSPTQYVFTSTNGPVYYNGIGPITSYAALASPGQDTAVQIDTSAADAPPPLDGFRWKIVNRSTGQVLDVAGTNDGANIFLGSDTGGLSQLWNIDRQYHTNDGNYPLDNYLYFTNANSGRVAEAANYGNDPNVQQYGTSASLLGRNWYIEETGDGYFYIRNAFSNMYLTRDSSSNNVIQSSFTGSASQQWKFDLSNPNPEDGLQLAQNASGTFSNATTIGNPTYSGGPGSVGKSIVLNGVDNYVQLAAGIANSPDLTVTAWVRWDGGDAWQRIFDFGNGTDQYMFLTPSSGDGKFSFHITTSGYQNELKLDFDPLTVGQWHNVAVTIGGNTAILYLDGVPVAAGQIPIDPSDFNPTQNYIGKSQFNDPLFAGKISGFSVYNFALSPAQIASLVALNNSGPIQLSLNPILTPAGGTTFSGSLGSFSTTASNPESLTYSGLIDWGDNSSSRPTLTATSANTFDISGSHTYALPGKYGVRITIRDSADNVAIGVTTIAVGSADELYLAQLYQDLLGRSIDPDGLATYSQLLSSTGDRQQVVNSLLNSHEYHVRQVRQVYQRFLARAADPEGLNTYVGLLDSGGRLEDVQAQLLSSDEYYQNRGGGTDEGFLNALYHDLLNRDADSEGMATYLREFAREWYLGANTRREHVALEILASQEYASLIVAQDYPILLRRAVDPDGMATYSTQLQQSGQSNVNVIAALVTSDEYYRQASSPTPLA